MNSAPVRRAGHRGLLSVLLGVGLVCAISASAQRPPSSVYERGKAIYERNCTACHGKEGRGDTPVARLLSPRPRNFADPVEMARVTVDRMYRVIKGGSPGTAMAAWGEILTETEIGDVIDYIRSLEPPRGTEQTLSGERLSVEIGRRIYERECASCHGLTGRADTRVAGVLDPPPRNFADPIGMARLDDGRMFLAILRGKPGTAMGGRGELLTPPEIIDVIRYLRTLAQPPPAGMTPAQLDVRVGELIYRQYCVACHGAEGNGQTPLGLQLSPRPRDFTDSSGIVTADDRRLTQSITRGIAGTAMAPWDGVLNKEDVRRVIAYIRQKFTAAGRAASTQQ